MPSVTRLYPGEAKSGVHGIIVALDSYNKALQLRNATADGLRHPGTQLLMLALTHDREKGLEQGMDSLHLRRKAEELLKSGLFFPIKILPLARGEVAAARSLREQGAEPSAVVRRR